MNPLPSLLASVLAVALAGCSSLTVTTEKDPAVDLSLPRTFGWMMEQDLGREGGRLDRENTYAAIAAAVEDSLAGKGWTLEQDPVKADVVLAFQVDMEKTVSVTSFREYDRNPWTWNRFYGSGVEDSIKVSTYDVGTLVLDMVHPTSRRLLWRGTAKAIVEKSDTRQSKADLAVEAVRRMFEKFR